MVKALVTILREGHGERVKAKAVETFDKSLATEARTRVCGLVA